MDSQLHDSQLHGVHSFTTLLQEGEESYNDYLPSLNDLESQYTPSNPEEGSSRKTKSRKGNFSTEEDNLLVLAWLNTSMDPINGVDQSKYSFWSRVHEYYEKNKKSISSERSSCSIRNRWSTIQLATNKFCGALAQIERRSPSGANEQDKIEKAKEFYRSIHPTSFNFLHCWTILRHHPKWKESVAEGSSMKAKRRSIIRDGHAPEFIDEDTAAPSLDVNLERPIGKKVAKKRKRQEDNSSNLTDLVIEIKGERIKSNAEKGEIRKEYARIAKERLEFDKQKEDNEIMRRELEIMRVDVSTLSPTQQEYFRTLQLEILEKQKSRKP
ncbi:glutathione S-transferase T3-like [Humulus lupulus]|uniref:glutathione S-transferase T3-like n=1 Tax=Humulus lupulus TaxID=3486 RepID=UPI002B406705|nr:glutathione S-transferase T3-like [Humulus lupulus]XP_062120541.1 glutathione S-transferase T3-like [Humulus lupulus]